MAQEIVIDDIRKDLLTIQKIRSYFTQYSHRKIHKETKRLSDTILRNILKDVHKYQNRKENN